jgi:hypothetical protein
LRRSGFGAGDTEVRRNRKTKTASNGRALDRSYDRLLVAEDAHRLAIKIAGGSVARRCVTVKARGPVEVRARAECLALRGQHHGAAVHIVIDLAQRVGDLTDQGEIEKIQRGRRISIGVTCSCFSTPISVNLLIDFLKFRSLSKNVMFQNTAEISGHRKAALTNIHA